MGTKWCSGSSTTKRTHAHPFKFNDIHESAPNDIQRDKIDLEFRKEFCAAIPRGDVSGWIGEVNSIDNNSPDKGIQLSLGVNTQDLSSGGLGVELSLGNYYAYGVDRKNTQPHGPTVIPVSSPLYNTVSTFRSGDTVIFSGTFIPYSSQQACYRVDIVRDVFFIVPIFQHPENRMGDYILIIACAVLVDGLAWGAA